MSASELNTDLDQVVFSQNSGGLFAKSAGTPGRATLGRRPAPATPGCLRALGWPAFAARPCSGTAWASFACWTECRCGPGGAHVVPFFFLQDFVNIL